MTEYVVKGWPVYMNKKICCRSLSLRCTATFLSEVKRWQHFYHKRSVGNVFIISGVLVFVDRIIILQSERLGVLQRIHQG